MEALTGERRTYSMSMHAFVVRAARTAGSRCDRYRCGRLTERLRRWFGTATDITDLVEARDSLRRSNEELEARVVERTREREVALRQLARVAEDGEHRSADRRRGARLQQSAGGHTRQPGAVEERDFRTIREPRDCWKARSKARSAERR